MAPPPTSFNMTEEEMAQLSSEEKQRVAKEWREKIEAAKRSRANNGTSGTSSVPITSPPAYVNTFLDYSSRAGGHYDSYPNSFAQATRAGYSYTLKPQIPYYNPYDTSLRPRFQNVSQTFTQTDSPALSHTPGGKVTRSERGVQASQNKQRSPRRSTLPCPAFTSTGICSRPGCWKVHDQYKVAICKRFLYKDNCPDGDLCPLSHTPSLHNAPACIYFRSGACTKDDCRFAHVRVSPAAAVCKAFARLGYCEKGGDCANRHAFECPDFTNKNACGTVDCPLPHITHAGRLRARDSTEAESPSATNSPENGVEDRTPITFTSDYSDTHESRTSEMSPKDRSDAPESDMLDISNDDNQYNARRNQPTGVTGLSQQADFVPFE